MERKRSLRINLWKKDGGKHFISHSQGLTQEDMEHISNLKLGDRLVLFTNDKNDDKYPDVTLRKFNAPEKSEEEI